MRGDESDPVAIEVRRGYSRDHRPDLMQFVSNLCCGHWFRCMARVLAEKFHAKVQASLWEKDLKRIETNLKRRAKLLQKQVFACRPDTLEALLQFQESLDHHQVVEALEGYQLRFSWQRKPEAEQKLREARSRFILATNQLDADEYPAQLILTEYQQQQKVERGCQFLKDPLFFHQQCLCQEAATGRSVSVSRGGDVTDLYPS